MNKLHKVKQLSEVTVSGALGRLAKMLGGKQFNNTSSTIVPAASGWRVAQINDEIKGINFIYSDVIAWEIVSQTLRSTGEEGKSDHIVLPVTISSVLSCENEYFLVSPSNRFSRYEISDLNEMEAMAYLKEIEVALK